MIRPIGPIGPIRPGRSRGNAMVEFAILLPIYLLLLLGAFYLGRVAFFQERSYEANRLATQLPGDQSEGGDRHGPVSQAFFDTHAGSFTLVEIRETIPSLDSIDHALYPPSPPQEPIPPHATGYTDIDLDSLADDLETVISPTQSQAGREPQPPVRDNRLLQGLHELMRNWVERSTSESYYRYDPGYLTLNHLQFKPVTPTAAHQISGRSELPRDVRSNQGSHLAPNLINRFGDGQAPVPGFPAFADLPDHVMSPN